MSSNDAVEHISHRNQLLQNASDGVTRPTGREYLLDTSFFPASFLGCQCGAAPLTPDTPVIATGSGQITSVQLHLLQGAPYAGQYPSFACSLRAGAPAAPR